MKWKMIFVAACAAICGGFWLLQSGGGPHPLGQSHGLLTEANAQQIVSHVRGLNSPLVLVNFWASWCEPCKQEFPEILKLRKKLQTKGLQVVFVSIDEPRDAEAAEEFLKEQKVDFQTFYKGTQPLEFVSQIYPAWDGSVPTSVLVGPEFKILDAWEGDTTMKEFEHRVLKQLGGT